MIEEGYGFKGNWHWSHGFTASFLHMISRYILDPQLTRSSSAKVSPIL